MAQTFDDEIRELLSASSADNRPALSEFRVLGGAGKETAIVGDAYDGASRQSRELAKYNPSTKSADLDMAPAKKMADARSRDLGRNDAFLQNGIESRKDNIVGHYFMLNAKPNSTRLFGKEDVTWEDEFSEEAEELFAADAESIECFMDATGRNTLTQLVRLAIEQHTIYGEVLASVEWIPEFGRTCATAINLIDTDRLSTPPTKADDKNVTLGVQMDPVYHRPIGYHIRMAHPSDWRSGNAYEWKYVPARMTFGRRQMIHLFDQHRPAQSRGLGVMVSAIPEMKMAKQFRQIVLQNAILNATFAATIESDTLDPAMIYQMLGGEDCTPESIETLMTSYMAGHFNTMSKLMGGSKNLHIDGVKIPHLPPGTKLNLNGAGQGGPLGTDFEESLNRVMAAALGLSYEQFSRDYSNTNYSSARAAMGETFKAMMAVKRAIADRFASMVFRLWMEEMLNKGEFTTIKRRMPNWYEGRNREWYSACDWIGASRGQIDELKETQAAILKINNGLSTIELETAKMGHGDWRKQMRQLKREKDWKEFYKVLQVEQNQDQQNALSGNRNEKKADASIPSPGTAEALFLDSDTNDEKENGDE